MTISEQMSVQVGARRGVAAADRLCVLCVELLAVDAAAISLIFDGAASGTLGVSGAAARRYDELQFTLGEGPCLQAVSDRAPVLVADLADTAQSGHPDDTADADGSRGSGGTGSRGNPGDAGGSTRGRWPLHTPAMLDFQIRSVYALPVVLAGEYLGALDLFRHRPGMLDVEQLAGAIAAAQLAELPLLDLLADDLQETARDPDSAGWAELNAMFRLEVSQATGMIVGQLDIEPAEALVRLRAHAYATGRGVTEVARDILDRRLRLDP